MTGALVGAGAAGDDAGDQQHHHGEGDRGEEPAGEGRVAGRVFDQQEGAAVGGEQPGQVGGGDAARRSNTR